MSLFWGRRSRLAAKSTHRLFTPDCCSSPSTAHTNCELLLQAVSHQVSVKSRWPVRLGLEPLLEMFKWVLSRAGKSVKVTWLDHRWCEVTINCSSQWLLGFRLIVISAHTHTCPVPFYKCSQIWSELRNRNFKWESLVKVQVKTSVGLVLVWVRNSLFKGHLIAWTKVPGLQLWGCQHHINPILIIHIQADLKWSANQTKRTN